MVYIGVPAVVALIRLFGEPLRAIDRDALCHAHSAVFDGIRSARNRGTIGMRSHEKRNRKSKGRDLSKSLSSSAADHTVLVLSPQIQHIRSFVSIAAA